MWLYVFILESKTQPTAPQNPPRVFGTKDSCLQQFSLVLASALWPLGCLAVAHRFHRRLAEIMSPAPSILCPIPTVRRWENPAQSCHFWHFLLVPKLIKLLAFHFCKVLFWIIFLKIEIGLVIEIRDYRSLVNLWQLPSPSPKTAAKYAAASWSRSL